MAENEGTGLSKAGAGLACVACCSIPMLVIVGVVSVATAATFGVAAGSVALVGWATLAFSRGRLPVVQASGRAGITAVGAAAALVGLALIGDAPAVGRLIVTAGLAVLAVAALFALSGARTTAARGTT